MNNTLRIAAIGIGIAAAMLYPGCGKKKAGTNEVIVPQTTKTVDYSYTVSAFKRNVSWSQNDENWQPVTMGLGIAKGGFVETGEASAATLNGVLGDIVMLGEKAKVQLLIEKLEKQANGNSLAARGIELVKGMARFKVAKGAGAFVVETPSARIKVKGTDFVVTIDEKTGGTDVCVREGLVDVEDKKQSRKTVSLVKGYALIGAGTANPVQRSMTTKENGVFDALQQSFESGEGAAPSAVKENPEEIKKRLDNEAGKISGRETHKENVKAQAALDNERAESQGKIDSVKAGYRAAVQADKDTFSVRKAVAAAVVDSTKSAAQSALDSEREKFENAAGKEKNSPGKSSDDAFDELHKRKAGR